MKNDPDKVVNIQDLKKGDIFYRLDRCQFADWTEKRVCLSEYEILVKDKIILVRARGPMELDGPSQEINYTWHSDGEMHENGIPIDPNRLILNEVEWNP